MGRTLSVSAKTKDLTTTTKKQNIHLGSNMVQARG